MANVVYIMLSGCISLNVNNYSILTYINQGISKNIILLNHMVSLHLLLLLQ